MLLLPRLDVCVVLLAVSDVCPLQIEARRPESDPRRRAPPRALLLPRRRRRLPLVSRSVRGRHQHPLGEPRAPLPSRSTVGSSVAVRKFWSPPELIPPCRAWPVRTGRSRAVRSDVQFMRRARFWPSSSTCAHVPCVLSVSQSVSRRVFAATEVAALGRLLAGSGHLRHRGAAPLRLRHAVMPVSPCA